MKGTGPEGARGQDWNGDAGLEEGGEKTVYVCCGLVRVTTNVHASSVEWEGNWRRTHTSSECVGARPG